MLRFSSLQVHLATLSRVRVRHVAVVSGCFALVAACSADKNYEQRRQAWEEQAAAAKAEGNNVPAPASAIGDQTIPVECIRSCIPDPAPPPVDCATIEDLNHFEYTSPPVMAQQADVYTYDDYSAAPPIKTDVTMNRCSDPKNSDPKNTVAHIFGGPYQAWGGGIGRSIKNWWGSSNPLKTCTGPGTPFPCESPVATTLGIATRTVDLSQWDGVSLWARRGPEGQTGIRVTVGDKTTDDDLNIEQDAGQAGDNHVANEQVYCKRARRCDCSGNSLCSAADIGGHYCFDPLYQPQPTSDSQYQRCGQDACDAPYEAGGADPAFNGKSCTPYQLQNGYTRSFCFNPGVDPDPPETTEYCGDHFQTPIRLSTEWQLYRVPFSGMRQQSFGKESPGLSTDQISLVRLTFEGGWIDYYIDDVRFYRVKR